MNARPGTGPIHTPWTSRGSLPAIAIAAAATMPGKARAPTHKSSEVLLRESRAAHERRDIAPADHTEFA